MELNVCLMATAYGVRDLCGRPAQGERTCHALVRANPDGSFLATGTPQGYSPAQLQSAYNVTPGGTGTVAIVVAQDDPNAESDLAVYRSEWAMAPCTTPFGRAVVPDV